MAIGLQRGIVEKIISPYEYKVRIVNYNSDLSDPNKVITADLPSAFVSTLPGVTIAYKEGDRVVVGFNKDELSSPIILGSMATEAYGTDSAQVELEQVKEAEEAIDNLIEKIENQELYTHLKYSNDGGRTFTSLYDSANTEVVTDEVGISYVTCENIVIDSSSSVIYWSILDADGNNAIDSFKIKTTVKAGTSEGEEFNEVFTLGTDIDDVGNSIDTIYTSTDTVIEVPFRLSTFPDMRLDFSINNKINFDKYHIVLTTDKDLIGSVYGKYLGVCITNDPVPPDNPAAYVWTTFQTAIQNIVNNLNDDLEPRVIELEKSVFGKEDNLDSDLGLADNMTISESQIDIHGTANRNIALNNSKSVFVNNSEDSMDIKNVAHTAPSGKTIFLDQYGANGHLTLVVKSK